MAAVNRDRRPDQARRDPRGVHPPQLVGEPTGTAASSPSSHSVTTSSSPLGPVPPADEDDVAAPQVGDADRRALLAGPPRRGPAAHAWRRGG